MHVDMRSTATIQRIENAVIAVAIILAMIATGQPWWLLPAAFLLFDLSMIGYLGGPRAGALAYNLVHSYTGPAIALAAYFVLMMLDVNAIWIALLSACWAFHVAVDRALGYGLKLGDFQHTHLGRIGRASREDATSEVAS